MRKGRILSALGASAVLVGVGCWLGAPARSEAGPEEEPAPLAASPEEDGHWPAAEGPAGPSAPGPGAKTGAPVPAERPAPARRPLSEVAGKGVAWLVAAQHPDGGWGGGSHASQGVRDPHAVQTDPATTAFTAMALLRAGHTPAAGEHRDVARRALAYLLQAVETAPEGARITEVTGTQPQSKLGGLIDTAMTAQYLARALGLLPDGDALRARTDRALEVCLEKLQTSQQQNGSWGQGGWAPVLQSAYGCTALELAQVAGKEVDARLLENARQYQKGNFDAASGRAVAGDAAGVELYAFSGAQRANAADVAEVRDALEKAKREGTLPEDAEVTVENVVKMGYRFERAQGLSGAWQQNEAQVKRLDDPGLLAGFGNNGGEEFLSYLLTGESLFITDPAAWATWDQKMHTLLGKVQNPDGSWSGHHCITSPVFCTAAAVQVLTVDRDGELLRKVSQVDRAVEGEKG